MQRRTWQKQQQAAYIQCMNTSDESTTQQVNNTCVHVHVHVGEYMYMYYI